MAVQFSGISAALGEAGVFRPSISYLQPTEYGPQLIRVVTEAFFDSVGPEVPASADSTACKLGMLPCAAESDKEVLLALEQDATRAEALAASIAGHIIRGASILALNNEAAAKSLETLAGVIARKWVEKKTWQRRQCDKPFADKPFAPAYVTVTS